MYNMPAAPAFGLAVSPTPSVSFLTAATLTPDRSVSAIFHCVQVPFVDGRRHPG